MLVSETHLDHLMANELASIVSFCADIIRACKQPQILLVIRNYISIVKLLRHLCLYIDNIAIVLIVLACVAVTAFILLHARNEALLELELLGEHHCRHSWPTLLSLLMEEIVKRG